MKNFKTFLVIFAIFFYLGLSSSAALAANIVVDKAAGPSGSGLFHTPNYANDAACIQAALDYSKSGDTIIIRAGDYYLTKGIYQIGKSLNIVGDGKVILYIRTSSKEYNDFFFGGSLVANQNLSANASKGSSKVVLTNASRVRQNDLVKIWKNVQWCPLPDPNNYPDQMTGEIYAVKSVNGNIVTLNQALLRDYRLSETVQVEVYRPIQIHITNIRIQDTGEAMLHHGLSLQYCKDSSITKSWFNASGFGAVCLYSCFNVSVNNNEIYNSLSPNCGYGVNAASGSAFINISNNYIENCRHAVTGNSAELKSLNRDVFITDNTLIGAKITGSNVVDAHADTINFVVTGNKIYPQITAETPRYYPVADYRNKPDLPYYYAFTDGTQQSIFSKNEVYGGFGGILKRGAVNDGVHIYENNVFTGIAGNMYEGGNGTDDSIIIRNNIQKSGMHGIIFPFQGSVRNLILSGNTFSNLSYQGVYQKFFMNGENINISKNTFSNIKREGIYLDGNSFKNGEVIIKNNTFINVNSSNSSSGITIKNIQNPIISGNQIIKVPTAAFSVSPSSGAAPLIVTFYDNTTGSPTAWNWSFGDGTYSTVKNPVHTYPVAGNYTVTLTVSNENGKDSKTTTIQVFENKQTLIILGNIYNNRLREASPENVFSNNLFLDIGGISGVGRYRDVVWFDLSGYTRATQINKATLSLLWYYPNSTRLKDTVIEIYRPVSSWNSNFVSWNKKDKNIAWNNPGGDWNDKNGVLQGSTPYATLTLKASDLPNDKIYCELNVTDLLREYISGKFENTGFLIKARTEGDNYVAFYGADCKLRLSTSALPTANLSSNVTSAPILR